MNAGRKIAPITGRGSLPPSSSLYSNNLWFHGDISNPLSYDSAVPNLWTNLVSGNPNMTLYSSPLYSGGIDANIRFTGSQRGYLPPLHTSTYFNNWSVSFWFKYYGGTSTYDRLFGMTSYRNELAVANGNARWYRYWDVTGQDLQSPTTEWHNIVITVTYLPTRQVQFWKNGVLIKTLTARGYSMGGNHSFYLMSQYNGGERGKGYLGEFLLYTETLTQAEVMQNYNHNKIRFGR